MSSNTTKKPEETSIKSSTSQSKPPQKIGEAKLNNSAHKPDIPARRDHTINGAGNYMMPAQLATETGRFEAYFTLNMAGILTTNWGNVMIIKSTRNASKCPLWRDFGNAEFSDAVTKSFLAHSSPAIPIQVVERNQRRADFVKIAKIADESVDRIPIPIRFTNVKIKATLTVNGFVREANGDYLPSDLMRVLLSYYSYKYEATAIYPRIWDVYRLNYRLTGVRDTSILQHRKLWTLDEITIS